MRPAANGALQATCALIILSIVPTDIYGTGLASNNGDINRLVSVIMEMRPGGRINFNAERQWETHPLKYCNLERCKITCQRHTQHEEDGVESARCVGSQCVCQYKSACNVSDCYQKCAREKFAKLSNRENCYTRECFCLFDDRCEKRNCAEGCRGRGQEGDGVRGVCIDSACSCRRRW